MFRAFCASDVLRKGGERMKPYTMTFEETFMSIRQGDIGVIAAFAIECLIMASPILIGLGAWLASR